MLVIMSNIINMEFVQALNPLYAFPIVAVIFCAFIVYAFGFKSPVQPPSFDGIEEEKKISKKKKTKDTSKAKIVQNGKQNGSMSNKTIVSSTKKKDADKSVNTDKPVVEKHVNEKKVTKKAKPSNEKKVIQEKKKEVISQMQDDAGEDGWVQLISKKGRKNRKKDEMVTTESQTVIKPPKISHADKFDENTPSEEFPAKVDVLEKVIPEKKIEGKSDKEDTTAATIENKDKVVIIEAESTVYDSNVEKPPAKDVLKNEKLNEEASNKSKKKKKKNVEVINKDSDCIHPSDSPAVQVTPEVPTLQNTPNNAIIITETPEIITDKVQENEPKELKSSNVVFDELEGLYPKEKDQKKKKRVRRDH